MKANWQLNRSFAESDDGQRRWDYVYQYLLQWAMEQNADPGSAPSQPQEEQHGNRHLCSRLDPTPTTASND